MCVRMLRAGRYKSQPEGGLTLRMFSSSISPLEIRGSAGKAVHSATRDRQLRSAY